MISPNFTAPSFDRGDTFRPRASALLKCGGDAARPRSRGAMPPGALACDCLAKAASASAHPEPVHWAPTVSCRASTASGQIAAASCQSSAATAHPDPFRWASSPAVSLRSTAAAQCQSSAATAHPDPFRWASSPDVSKARQGFPHPSLSQGACQGLPSAACQGLPSAATACGARGHATAGMNKARTARVSVHR
jgi:hypothetical protein